MHRCFDAKKLLSSDEAGDSSFNFGRNIEFKKMIISMQKKKTRALCTVFFLLCGFSPWSAIEILFKEMR